MSRCKRGYGPGQLFQIGNGLGGIPASDEGSVKKLIDGIVRVRCVEPAVFLRGCFPRFAHRTCQQLPSPKMNLDILGILLQKLLDELQAASVAFLVGTTASSIWSQVQNAPFTSGSSAQGDSTLCPRAVVMNNGSNRTMRMIHLVWKDFRFRSFRPPLYS